MTVDEKGHLRGLLPQYVVRVRRNQSCGLVLPMFSSLSLRLGRVRCKSCDVRAPVSVPIEWTAQCTHPQRMDRSRLVISTTIYIYIYIYMSNELMIPPEKESTLASYGN